MKMKRVRLLSLLWLPLVLLMFKMTAPANQKVQPSTLTFVATPQKHIFRRGEDVVLALSIISNSTEPVFVSRLTNEDFVDIELVGPDGKEVSWQGSGKIHSKQYSPSDFTVLKHGERISAKRTISLKDGQGYVIKAPGRYSVKAQYSLEPPEYFAPLAGSARVPAGGFASPASSFCVESCNPSTGKR
ncbi:MAG: hypothetical protein WA491_06035 [Candidatus Acidiferrum sp.]